MEYLRVIGETAIPGLGEKYDARSVRVFGSVARRDNREDTDNCAEWRADERRWCGESKLPSPGWWSMEATGQ